MREKILTQENEELNLKISQLQGAASERESYLEMEIAAVRKQMGALVA